VQSETFAYISADEQLNKIFAIIGSPQDSDMEDLRKLATAPKTLGVVPSRRFSSTPRIALIVLPQTF
jgi:hypothetical protein